MGSRLGPRNHQNAVKANAAGDFATVASSLQTVVDKMGTAIGSLIAEGGESGADLTILDESGDTVGNSLVEFTGV
jgi:hypothetical protein